MTPDTSPLVLAGRTLPGDLRALLDGMPGGVRVAQALAVAGQVETTRHLLAVAPEDLRFVKGLGGQPGVRPLVTHLREAWGVEPGCLAGASATDGFEAEWDLIHTLPEPTEHSPPLKPGTFSPQAMAAIQALHGRIAIRRCTTFDRPKVKARFLQLCRGGA